MDPDIFVIYLVGESVLKGFVLLSRSQICWEGGREREGEGQGEEVFIRYWQQLALYLAFNISGLT